MLHLQVALAESDYPIIGVVTAHPSTHTYVAWSEQDLLTCPFHEYLRTRKAHHTLVTSSSRAFNVTSTSFEGIAWQRFREVGYATELFAVLLSGFNFPVRIKPVLEESTPPTLSKLREQLCLAVKAKPSLYTTDRSEKAVLQSLARAKNLRGLAAALSPASTHRNDA